MGAKLQTRNLARQNWRNETGVLVRLYPPYKLQSILRLNVLHSSSSSCSVQTLAEKPY